MIKINNFLKDIFSNRLSYKERYKIFPYYNRYIKIIYLLHSTETIYLQTYDRKYYNIRFHNKIKELRKNK
jgi:hypothetical protein